MPNLSKNQFIILAIIVIAITVVIIIATLNNNQQVDMEVSNNEADKINQDKNKYQDEEFDNVLGFEQEGQESFENDENNQEQEIDTQPQNMQLLQIQKRVEVVTDKNSQQIFKDMISPSPAQIEEFIGVDLSNMESYVVRIAQDKFSSELYMIFKPFEEYKDESKAQIKKFLLNYESAWSRINEEQYKLVENRTAIERSGYIIYIISIDNNTIMNEIRNYI